MDYTFSKNGGTEYIRVPAEKASAYTGQMVVTETYADSKVTHHFLVGRKAKQTQNFVWLVIANHITIVDNTAKLEAENAMMRKRLEEQSDALIELADIIAGGENNG